MMIKDVCLNKDEFKNLELRMSGTFGNDIIYRGKEDGVAYLLRVEHDLIIGNYYKGIKLIMKDSQDVKKPLPITLEVPKPYPKYDALAEDTCPEYKNRERLRG